MPKLALCTKKKRINIVSHTEMINQYENAGSDVEYYHSPQCNNVASHQDR